MAKKEDVRPQWLVVNGDGRIVGRFATAIATVLMGKHKPEYTPHVDCGDCAIVVNAHLVRFSGAALAHSEYPYLTTKMARKEYERYTGYPGGRKILSGIQVWEKHPERILQEAVRRMLPKSKLGRAMLKKLKLFTAETHCHQAQQPVEFPEYLLK
ncbi:MAG: 50S ribosomal protein L13 [Planctomycetaceae bacterium]